MISFCCIFLKNNRFTNLESFECFFILFNPFSTGKIEKLWDSNISTNFKYQELKKTGEKSFSLHIVRTLFEYSLKNVGKRIIVTITGFEIYLFKRRSVLRPEHRVLGRKKVQFSVKNRKKYSVFVRFVLKDLC